MENTIDPSLNAYGNPSLPIIVSGKDRNNIENNVIKFINSDSRKEILIPGKVLNEFYSFTITLWAKFDTPSTYMFMSGENSTGTRTLHFAMDTIIIEHFSLST